MKIAFLHTSPVHIDRFEKIVSALDKRIETCHFVHEELLKFALQNGSLDKNSFISIISNIQLEEPNRIICTCSTYGQLCDSFPDVYRIDQPIAEYLVANYSKIILAYTVSSTKKISVELLQKIAIQQSKKTEIILCDATESWRYFENDDFKNYELSIATKIKSIANQGEVIFLAQASMEGAKKYLNSLSIETFTSPEFGLKKFVL